MVDQCIINLLENENVKKAIAEGKFDMAQVEAVTAELRKIKGFANFSQKAKLLRADIAEKATYAIYLANHDKNLMKKTMGFIANTKFIDEQMPNKIHEALVESPDVHAEGGKNSYGNTLNGRQKVNAQVFINEVDKFHDVVIEPANQRDIAMAVDAVNRGQSLDKFQPVIREVAQAIKRVNHYIVTELEKAGVFINERADYIMRQSHDIAKISGAKTYLDPTTGKNVNEWVEFIHTKLDIDKTFPLVSDIAEQKKILTDTYEEIITGEHGAGLGVLGRKRSLHFKDGASWFDYHEKFGTGTIVDSLRSALDTAAKTEAMFTHFGSDPKKFWSTVEKNVGEMVKEKHGIDAYKKYMNKDLFGQKNYRDNIQQTVFGYHHHPAMGLPAKILQVIQTIGATAKLQMSSFSTLTDTAITVSNFMAKTGVNPFEAHARYLRTYVKNFTPTQTRKAGKLLGMCFDIDVADKYGLFEGSSGSLKKMSRFAMKITGLNATTRINRTTGAMMFSNYLADMSDRLFKDLDPRLQSELADFNIKDAEWDIIRTAITDADGIKLVTPEALSKLEVFRDSKHKRNIENSLLAFISHNSDMSSPQTGIRTRASAFQGTSPNSFQGQILRTFMQFKSFPLQVGKTVSEITQAGASGHLTFLKSLQDKGNLGLFGMLMAEGTVMAGIGLMARDLAQGKTPRDMTTIENLTEALSRSMIPFQMEQFLSMARGEYAMYNRNILQNLAGPTFGQLPDIAKAVSLTATGKSPAKIIGKLLDSNIPMKRHPVLNPLINTAGFNAFLNWTDPKRVANINKSMAKKGQKFLAPLFNPE